MAVGCCLFTSQSAAPPASSPQLQPEHSRCGLGRHWAQFILVLVGFHLFGHKRLFLTFSSARRRVIKKNSCTCLRHCWPSSNRCSSFSRLIHMFTSVFPSLQCVVFSACLGNFNPRWPYMVLRSATQNIFWLVSRVTWHCQRCRYKVPDIYATKV